MRQSSQKSFELEKAISDLGSIRRGRGQRYPKHLRAKIEELMHAGYSINDIQGISGIPLITLRSWKMKSVKDHFKQLPVMNMAAEQKVRIYFGPNIWLEVDRSSVTADLIRMLGSAL